MSLRLSWSTSLSAAARGEEICADEAAVRARVVDAYDEPWRLEFTEYPSGAVDVRYDRELIASAYPEGASDEPDGDLPPVDTVHLAHFLAAWSLVRRRTPEVHGDVERLLGAQKPAAFRAWLAALALLSVPDAAERIARDAGGKS